LILVLKMTKMARTLIMMLTKSTCTKNQQLRKIPFKVLLLTPERLISQTLKTLSRQKENMKLF